MTTLTVQRNKETQDGLFGALSIDNDPFTCYTVENKLRAIPAGSYTLNFTYSPRFGKFMPHIIVPERDAAAGGDAGIRIHPANYPHQLEGCIAVGDSLELNAVINSRSTFQFLMEVIREQADLRIIVLNIPKEEPHAESSLVVSDFVDSSACDSDPV